MFDLPYPLLYRTGTFEASQRVDMQRHPYLTARRLQHLDAIPEDVLFGIQDEHERPDGKGYPEEKTSATIHRFALALQVLDRDEAMIHPRPYRAEPFSPPAAMRELILLARADTLDRTTTQHWLTRLAYYPIGSYVRLNNGFAAKVASTHRDNPFSPIVLVFRDAKNRRWEPPRVLDLAENPHLHIAEVLPFEEWIESADHSVSEEGAVVEGEESQ